MTWNEYQNLVYRVKQETHFYLYAQSYNPKYEELYKKYSNAEKQLAKFERKILEKALKNLSQEDIINI